MESMVLVWNRVFYISEKYLPKSDLDIESYIAPLIKITLTMSTISVENLA